MRGRKQTPNKLKEMAGNPGKRPFDPDLKVSGDIPDCPSHLRGDAKKEWKRIIDELESKDLISQLDRGLLAAYCVAYATWLDASRHVQQEGAVTRQVISNKGQRLDGSEDVVYQDAHNPWASVMNKQAELMAKLGDKLGLDPTSRMRLMATGKESADPDEDFLFGKDTPKPATRDSIQ